MDNSGLRMKLASIHVEVNGHRNDVTGANEVELLKIVKSPWGWGTRILVKLLNGSHHFARCVVTMICKCEHCSLKCTTPLDAIDVLTLGIGKSTKLGALITPYFVQGDPLC